MPDPSATTVTSATPVAEVTGTVSIAAVSPSAPAATAPSDTLPEGVQQIRDFFINLSPERAIALAWQVLPGIAAGLAVGFGLIYGRRWLLRWLDRAPLPSADDLAPDDTSGETYRRSLSTTKDSSPSASAALPPTWRFWASQVLHGVQPWFIALLSIASALSFMPLPPSFRVVVGHVAAIAAIIQLGILLNRLLAHAAERYLSSYPNDGARITTVTTLVMISGILIWAMMLLMALASLGVNVNALIAGLGIGGVAVAFASQNILSSIFASLATVFDSPFALGDYIVSKDTAGTVEKIGLKTTIIRALSGEQVLIANNDLFSNRISNFGRMKDRRFVVQVPVHYATPPEKLALVPALFKQAISEQEFNKDARFDRCNIMANGFAFDRILFEAVFYSRKPELKTGLAIQQATFVRLVQLLSENGISLAGPMPVVHPLKHPDPANPANQQ